jgi:Cu+-exporting ATPase
MDQLNCDHCEDLITHSHIVWNKYNFCCDGCSQVFQILHQENDSTFYDLCEISNTTPPKATTSKSYADFLEELTTESNVKSIGKWEGQIHDITLFSEEMHCSACSWLIEKSLYQQKGIKSFQVHFVEGSLHLKYDASLINLANILKELSKYGYSFKPENQKNIKRVDDNLLIRIAISGAVFSNVMIFSIANYFGVYQGILAKWEVYFNIISFILNIPVVLYCAYPFFKKAYLGLTQKVLHMDLPISIGIIINFVLSTLSIMRGGNLFFDGLAGIIFFLLSGRWVVNHFEHKLLPDPNWFNNIFAQQIRKLDSPLDKNPFWIQPSEIETENTLLIKSGEFIPVNSILLSDEALLDPQLMTGESQYLAIVKGEPIKAGLQVLDKDIMIQSKENWNDSALSKMKEQWNQLNLYQNEKSTAEKIVPWFTASLFVFAIILFIHSPTLFKGLEDVGVLFIISCPCALALSRPLNLGMALNRAREAGFLIKSDQVILELSKIDTILFDKTGTLTSSRKQISHWEGDPLKSNLKSCLYQLCHGSTHPVAQSIAREFSEFTDGKIISRQEIMHWGIQGVIELEGQEFKFAFGSAKNTPSELDTLEQQQIDSFQNVIWLNNQPLAFLNFSDEIQPGVAEALDHLKEIDIQTVIVSGDSSTRVEAFSKKVKEIKAYGDLSPMQKLEHLKEFQKDHKVLSVGDGLNDTLLLQQSDLSILAHGGFQALSNGVDIIGLKSDWSYLPYLLNLSQVSNKAIKLSYLISLIYNGLALYFAFQGVLAPMVAAIAMPLSSLSVCLVSIILFRHKPKLVTK